MGSLDELRQEWMNYSSEASTTMANKLPKKSRASAMVSLYSQSE